MMTRRRLMTGRFREREGANARFEERVGADALEQLTPNVEGGRGEPSRIDATTLTK